VDFADPAFGGCSSLEKALRIELMNKALKDILICDDHSVCALGVEAVLKESQRFPLRIRKTTSGEDALRVVRESAPHLIILDLILPDIDGLELIQTLQREFPEMKILILTHCNNHILLHQVLQQKVQGLLQKTYSVAKIQEVIHRLLDGDGGFYLDPSVEDILRRGKETALTKREFEVLDLIIKGNTTKEIATLLNCSSETIKSHRSNIMSKVQARNTAELTAWYLDGNPKANRRPDSDD
jgi:DNA-binding NarL/FixJ family response regulator